jgi:hypothetical protein
MTFFIFEMANIKFKAMREKERRKKSIEAQPQLVYAHAPNHWKKKKNNTMLPTLLLKATFDR